MHNDSPLVPHLCERRAQQFHAERGLPRLVEERRDDPAVLLHVVEQRRPLSLIQLHRSGKLEKTLVLPRIELGSLDSESKMLTITL